MATFPQITSADIVTHGDIQELINEVRELKALMVSNIKSNPQSLSVTKSAAKKAFAINAHPTTLMVAYKGMFKKKGEDFQPELNKLARCIINIGLFEKDYVGSIDAVATLARDAYSAWNKGIGTTYVNPSSEKVGDANSNRLKESLAKELAAIVAAGLDWNSFPLSGASQEASQHIIAVKTILVGHLMAASNLARLFYVRNEDAVVDPKLPKIKLMDLGIGHAWHYRLPKDQKELITDNMFQPYDDPKEIPLPEVLAGGIASSSTAV